MIDDDLVRAHRARALNPEHPFMRGTAHNPDTFFQARETVNPFYARDARHRAGGDGPLRRRSPAGSTGCSTMTAPADAERVIVLMGSGAETARETATALARAGEKVGVLQVRLYRPFSAERIPRRAAGDRAAPSPCSSGPRSRARRASRSISTWSRRSPQACRAASGRTCRA